jgi:hypothetical protein
VGHPRAPVARRGALGTCRYGDHVGTVEEIGLHSTRIRTLERTVVRVPNAEFVQMQLDNLTRATPAQSGLLSAFSPCS